MRCISASRGKANHRLGTVVAIEVVVGAATTRTEDLLFARFLARALPSSKDWSLVSTIALVDDTCSMRWLWDGGEMAKDYKTTKFVHSLAVGDNILRDTAKVR